MTVRRLDYAIDTTTVNTTVSETELVSLAFPANTLEAAGHAIRATVGGDFLNNTGGADTIVFKVKIGSSVALTTPATSLGASANRRKWRLVVDIVAETGVLQRLSAVLHISDATTNDFAAAGTYLVGYGTDAETGATASTVSVTATLGSSSANLEVTRKVAVLEAVR